MGWDGIRCIVPWDKTFVSSHPIRSPGSNFYSTDRAHLNAPVEKKIRKI
jgi:hypothetical protein